jgi:hypothetical protein
MFDNSASHTSGDSPRARRSELTSSKARLSRLDAPANAAADLEFETGLDETGRGLYETLLAEVIWPVVGICEAGMDATRRALGAGVVCLDELTRRATGFGCFCVCANPATGIASVKSVRMNAVKGLV